MLGRPHARAHPTRRSCRLNWQLHFGEAPRWASDVRFVLVDVEPSELDAGKAALTLRADAGAAAEALLAGLRDAASGAGPLLPGAEQSGWAAALAGKAGAAREKLAARLARTAFPLDYHTTLRVVRDEINRVPAPGPIVVAEGANTMDNARRAAAGLGRLPWSKGHWEGTTQDAAPGQSACRLGTCLELGGERARRAGGPKACALAPVLKPSGTPTMPSGRRYRQSLQLHLDRTTSQPRCLLPHHAACRVLLEPVVAPRSRLDAGTHGTMGVGLGYALAAAVVHPERGVVAVEGDSAFGFSGMECETICRWA